MVGQHTCITEFDEAGREICRFCRRMISHPIISSDDPRLKGAGFMRSGGNIEEVLAYPPLPEVLIALYYNAQALGLNRAPAAWYIHNVAIYHGDKVDPDEIWTMLYKGWHAKWMYRDT